jgi:integrase
MRELEVLRIGASTRKRALAVLRSAFKALVDEWQLDKNPCDPIEGPRVRRKDFHAPNPAEIRILLDETSATIGFSALVLVCH